MNESSLDWLDERIRQLLTSLRDWSADGGWAYSLDLMGHLGLASGDVFPALTDLEEAGWIVSKWDSALTTTERRRLYRLTDLGRRAFASIVADGASTELVRLTSGKGEDKWAKS